MRRKYNPIPGISLSIILLFTACKPYEAPDKTSANPNPLNGAQTAAFDTLLTGLGRPEQVIRLMTETDPTWGSTDTVAATIKSEITSPNCLVTMISEPDAKNRYRRLLQISGKDCPVQLQYSLEQTNPGQPFFFNGTFLITSETLAKANGVRGMAVAWRALVSRRATSSEFIYKWNLSGTGQLQTFEKEQLDLSVTANLEKTTAKGQANYVGDYVVNIRGLEVPYTMVGEFRQSANSNLSKFRINGTVISQSAFEVYLSRLGFLVGLDSLTDAG